MGRGLSYRARFLLAFLLITGLALFFSGLSSRRVTSAAIDSSLSESARRIARLVAGGIATHLAEHLAATGGGDPDEALLALRVNGVLQEMAAEFARDIDGVVVVRDETGAPLAQGGELGDRAAEERVPEVRGAVKSAEENGRNEAGDRQTFGTVRGDAPIVYPPRVEDGAALGSVEVVLTNPYKAALWGRLETELLSIFAFSMGLAGLVGLVIVHRLARGMHEMIEVAEAIGEGDYQRRPDFYPNKEFAALARAINNMAERIEAHIATIIEQKSHMEAVLDGMREGVMVLDADGRIRSFNRALVKIFPEAAGREGRRPLEVIASPQLQKQVDAILMDGKEIVSNGSESAEEGVQPVGVTSMPLKAGQASLQVELSKDKVYDVNIMRLKGSPRELGAVIVFHDISPLFRLERVRRDFVANVSHELRTPLTSIKGYAETLLIGVEAGAQDSKAQMGFLNIILKNANHMVQMVNDLLHLAGLESGKKPFDVTTVAPSRAAAQAVKEMGHMAEEAGVTLDIRLNDALEDELAVEADFDRLVQVFRNLLENAVKYGGEERTVRLTAAPRGSKVVFSVRDEGPGIPKGEQKRIFERFYRLDKGREKSASSGLGLAICKHIVEKLGGRIWVVSPATESGGTTFSFTLPKAPGVTDEE